MTTKHEFARELYFQQDLTQADIARLLNVNPRTVYRWMKQENWIRIKASAYHAPAAITDKIYYLLNEMANTIISKETGQRIPTYEEARTMNLLTNVIDKLNSRSTLSEQIQVMTNFTSNLARTDIEKARLIVNEADNYIKAESRNGYHPSETAYGADEIDIITEELFPLQFEDGSSIQAPPEAQKVEIQVTPIQKAKCKEIRKAIKTLQPYPGISWMHENRVIDFIRGGSRTLTSLEWDMLLKKGFTEEELELALFNEFSWDKEKDE